MVSTFGIYACYGALLMHVLPFILPVCFSFKNKSKDNAFTWSSWVSLPGSIAVQVSIRCNHINLSIAAVALLSPNFLKHSIKLYCVIKYTYAIILSSDSVINSGVITCTVLLTVGSKCTMFDHVVAWSLSSFVMPAYCLASNTVLCTCTSPSCRKVVLGVYESYS